MLSSKKIVVVTAATGSQGFPIVKYLLAHHSDIYTVRAVTRNTSSPTAKSLASLGADIVSADFSDEPSLRSAFLGAHTIFANTNFWEPTMSLELEVAQGLLIAKVANDENGLENFIYSSLGDARVLYGGKYQGNLTYNAKAITLEKVVEGFPNLAAKMTVITIGFYQENWKKYQLVFGPKKVGFLCMQDSMLGTRLTPDFHRWQREASRWLCRTLARVLFHWRPPRILAYSLLPSSLVAITFIRKGYQW
jgi:NmrA-like family